jgi:hypothetical protein
MLVLKKERKKKKQSQLDPLTMEAMKSAVDINFTSLDMLRSSTIELLPDVLLELNRFVTTMSASQLESHLEAALVEKSVENYDIVGESADGVCNNACNDLSSNADSEADFMSLFAVTMRIIPC